MSIFVFGSNLKGIHGAGAAKHARQHHGALVGVGEGRMGASYALPTKVTPYYGMTMGAIKAHVSEFLDYAQLNPHLEFHVTQIGCGRAGWMPCQIAPLFYHHSSNCKFDEAWRKYLPEHSTQFWGTL